MWLITVDLCKSIHIAGNSIFIHTEIQREYFLASFFVDLGTNMCNIIQVLDNHKFPLESLFKNASLKDTFGGNWVCYLWIKSVQHQEWRIHRLKLG